MLKRYHVFVSGRVQGVFYRDFSKKCALLLNIVGWVKNLPDGRVEVIAEGHEQDLKEFVAKLHTGPEAANVESVIKEDEQPTGEFLKFSII